MKNKIKWHAISAVCRLESVLFEIYPIILIRMIWITLVYPLAELPNTETLLWLGVCTLGYITSQVKKVLIMHVSAIVHEAGHYVAAEHLGYIILSCEVFSKYKGLTLCKIPMHGPDGSFTATDCFQRAVFAYAGKCAEVQILSGTSYGFKEDMNDAKEYLQQYLILSGIIPEQGDTKREKRELKKIAKKCEKAARSLLKKNRTRIVEIAQILQEHGPNVNVAKLSELH